MKPLHGRRVLLLGYAGHPSLRLRLLQHVPLLEARGAVVKSLGLPQGRDADLFALVPELAREIDWANVVVVQRVLNRGLNEAIARSSKLMVLDIDDALHYVRPRDERTIRAHRAVDFAIRSYRGLVRGGPEVSSRKRVLFEAARIAEIVIVGSEWLRAELDGLAETTVVIPTSVQIHPKQLSKASQRTPLRIGWVGLKDNFRYLRMIEEPLRLLSETYGDDVILVVVSSEPYVTHSIQTEFVPWTLASEGAAVADFDIGIMPLSDDPFSRGKCGFKAVLCMAHGVPVVISPVGANISLIDDGCEGFFATGADDWVRCISRLVDDRELRVRAGAAGLENVRRRFEAGHAAERLAAILESV